jgi:hypothetical protein
VNVTSIAGPSARGYFDRAALVVVVQRVGRSPPRLAEMKTTVDAFGPGSHYGLGLHVIDTPCGPMFGHTGGVPGFSNLAFSSEDGSLQIGLTVDAEDAPAAVAEPFGLTVEQAVREAFSGSEGCRTGAGRARAAGVRSAAGRAARRSR